MLLPLAGMPLIWHAWNAAVQAFRHANVVVAIPASEENDELAVVVSRFGTAWKGPDYPVNIYRWDGPEDDVLGRFYHCAHRYRWHPDSIIMRITPDDPRKDPAMLKRVAAGERHPVELGGEAFTLAMLNVATDGWLEMPDEWRDSDDEALQQMAHEREHITHALFPTDPPPPPPGVWTVDTESDYQAMKKVME
jgi:spore coat polysaccharide biosynthesis protein SpsF (cytidylyltransferase family)